MLFNFRYYVIFSRAFSCFLDIVACRVDVCFAVFCKFCDFNWTR